MSSITEYMVQNGEINDKFLHRRLFDVNIRLFSGNEKYQSMVLSLCNYLIEVASLSFEDYPYVAGISGANVGIPFNIIAYRKGSMWEVMINPRIISRGGDTVTVFSNCGSLNLPEKVPVVRDKDVLVHYYDKEGNVHTEWIDLLNRGATIQHEVDHNNGILIA